MVKGHLKDFDGLHLEVLPDATRRAFLLLSKVPWLKTGEWYLAGGTALTLQVGHRSSVDLDFFTGRKKFDEGKMENALLTLGNWRTDSTDTGTVYGVFHGAKASFIAYPFFHPSPPAKRFGSIKIISPDDIAVMKIIAISQRGKKRDFIDLYWYCNNLGNLADTLGRTFKQYPQEHNTAHILKSLGYFKSAEQDPMPNLHFAVSWEKVKVYFVREVSALTRKFLEAE